MSVFEVGAAQICVGSQTYRNSQFRAGNEALGFQFVSSSGFCAKRRNVPKRPVADGWTQGRRLSGGAILVFRDLVRCVLSSAKAWPSTKAKIVQHLIVDLEPERGGAEPAATKTLA
jgi:hypothetical protein